VVALLIGGQLLGIVGALLALPIAAGLRVLIEQLRIDLPGEQPGEEAGGFCITPQKGAINGIA
jgi:predicted PurR-regulated permease PerM